MLTWPKLTFIAQKSSPYVTNDDILSFMRIFFMYHHDFVDVECTICTNTVGMNRHSIRYAYLPQTQHFSLKIKCVIKDNMLSFQRIILDVSTGSYRFRMQSLHKHSRDEKVFIPICLLAPNLSFHVHLHTKKDILSFSIYFLMFVPILIDLECTICTNTDGMNSIQSNMLTCPKLNIFHSK